MADVNVDVLIIGAGLTGLTTAFLLKKAGKNVALIEKTARAGGAISTHRHQKGYVFDTGPNTAVLSNHQLVQLFDLLKGKCQIELAHKRAQKRLIWKAGSLHALPSGLWSGFITPLFSWRDKIGILFEPFRPKSTNKNESVASLARRRLGKSIFNYAVDPFISGIYAGNPETLITRFALPKLYVLEQTYGSFIKGAFHKARQQKTPNDLLVTKEVFSIKGGMQNLTDALLHEIGIDQVYFNQNSEIKSHAGKWQVRINESIDTIIADTVISTVAPYELKSLFPFIDPQLMHQLTKMRYAPVIQVSIGSNNMPGVDLNAFGALIPSIEKRNVLGILYPSSCFEGRSPQNKQVLSLFVGGMQHLDLMQKTDLELKEMVISELKLIYKQNHLDIDFIHITRYPQAIPQYESSTEERLKVIKEITLKYPQLIVAGNMWGGIGMADRVKQAFDLAAKFV